MFQYLLFRSVSAGVRSTNFDLPTKKTNKKGRRKNQRTRENRKEEKKEADSEGKDHLLFLAFFSSSRVHFWETNPDERFSLYLSRVKEKQRCGGGRQERQETRKKKKKVNKKGPKNDWHCCSDRGVRTPTLCEYNFGLRHKRCERRLSPFFPLPIFSFSFPWKVRSQ